THRGESTACGRARTGLNGFRGFLARLAKMRVKVYETGGNHESGRVEHLILAPNCGNLASRSDFPNFVAIQKNIAQRVRSRCGVDDAPVSNEKHAENPLSESAGRFSRVFGLQKQDAHPAPNHRRGASKATPYVWQCRS